MGTGGFAGRKFDGYVLIRSLEKSSRGEKTRSFKIYFPSKGRTGSSGDFSSKKNVGVTKWERLMFTEENLHREGGERRNKKGVFKKGCKMLTSKKRGGGGNGGPTGYAQK